MSINSEVNQAFVAWKSSTGREKEWSLQSLVQKMESYATTICLQRLPDHKGEIDPLVSGIVWRAIRHADRFKNESKFTTWFYRIIVNECNRFLRTYKERFETSLEEDLPAPDMELDVRVDLIALLDKLGGTDYLLMRLVAEGEDFNQIGKALGVTRNAAIVRWNRLRGRLKDAI